MGGWEGEFLCMLPIKKKKLKRRLSCFGGKIFFLSLTCYCDSEISNIKPLGTLITLIDSVSNQSEFML